MQSLMTENDFTKISWAYALKSFLQLCGELCPDLAFQVLSFLRLTFHTHGTITCYQ